MPTNGLENWEDHPEDYIIVAETVESLDKEKDMIGYHIFNIAKSLSIIIEDQEIVRTLAGKMKEAGVKVVTLNEAIRILRTGN